MADNKATTATTATTATNKAIDTTTAKVATTKKGSRRISNVKAVESNVSRFVMTASVPIDARAMAQKALASALPALPGSTVFGHNDTSAMTTIIDGFLIDFATTGNVDSKSLIERAFNAITTTSKVAGLPVCKQIDATFIKVINHLNNFDSTSARYKKYLSAKKPNKRYNAIQLADFIDGFKPICQVLVIDFTIAKKAAKAAYVKQWAELKQA